MRVGVDLGGTKIAAVALNDTDEEVARSRVPTPDSYQEVLRAISSLVAAIEEEAGEQGTIGVGTPGAISPATGLIKNSNTEFLNGKPLHEDLERTLNRPVRIANDADCFALSEATDGAAASAPSVFGVILGTGVGGGLVVRGELVTGPNAIGGEWGHNPLPMTVDELPGPDCYCGRSGCVETWLSGPGLASDFERSTGRTLTPPEIAAEAADGEAHADAALERYSDRMARALALVINVVDPYVVVVGGGVSKIGQLYEMVPARWGTYVFSDRVDTKLVEAAHGDSSGVRGAARLWSR